MKLTLRTARKLESKISEQVEQGFSELNTTVKVRVNTDKSEVKSLLDQARTEYVNKTKSLKALLELQFQIRDRIAEQNAKSGLDSLVTKKVQVEKLLSKTKSLGVIQLRLTDAEVDDVLTLGKNNFSKGETNRFHSESAVHTNLSFLEKADVDVLKKERTVLQKEVDTIEDKLSELNNTQKIELKAEEVTLLQESNLL